MSQDHNHLNHATWECKYHVVFTPKYRKKLLFGKIKRTECRTEDDGIFSATNSGREDTLSRPLVGMRK